MGQINDDKPTNEVFLKYYKKPKKWELILQGRMGEMSARKGEVRVRIFQGGEGSEQNSRTQTWK